MFRKEKEVYTSYASAIFKTTVGPRFTNLIRSWRPFVNRNVRKPKLFFP
jgi:hypothetical protein